MWSDGWFAYKYFIDLYSAVLLYLVDLLSVCHLQWNCFHAIQ